MLILEVLETFDTERELLSRLRLLVRFLLRVEVKLDKMLLRLAAWDFEVTFLLREVAESLARRDLFLLMSLI